LRRDDTKNQRERYLLRTLRALESTAEPAVSAPLNNPFSKREQLI
jgi:hypothetical protein